jgi:hypothetical protein
MQQQQDDFMTRYKRNFNVAFTLCLMFQRALVVPMRNRFGVEALGTPCLLALIMLVVWSSLSQDIYLWIYTGIWLVFFVHRRAQSVRLSQTERNHSLYDGWPCDAIRVCKDEANAKLYIEPIMVGFAAAFAVWFYDQRGWNCNGLPYFLITGCSAMFFVELAQQTAWKRRSRQMDDARIENEQMMNEAQDRWGDS